MSVLDWFRSESKQFRATFLPRAGGATAVAQAHYVRLWVVEMMLADGRKLFDKYTPAVHGAVRFTAGQQTREIATIAGPAALPGLSKVEGDVVHIRMPVPAVVESYTLDVTATDAVGNDPAGPLCTPPSRMGAIYGVAPEPDPESDAGDELPPNLERAVSPSDGCAAAPGGESNPLWLGMFVVAGLLRRRRR